MRCWTAWRGCCDLASSSRTLAQGKPDGLMKAITVINANKD
jgi:hypothetical protein